MEIFLHPSLTPKHRPGEDLDWLHSGPPHLQECVLGRKVSVIGDLAEGGKGTLTGGAPPVGAGGGGNSVEILQRVGKVN